ncbi:MAG: Cobalt-zinc-cadmium resistance protein [Firmicutes bacterium]|nr:Cobalt-zinc-cadmium resistance protein [Bacillota bacterium]MDI6706815.1 cation diffusion facilitator family transporter [Bacillota bacterium]
MRLNLFSGEWLKKKFIVEKHRNKGIDTRLATGLLEAWVSIIGNVVLFIIKFAIGAFIGSISIIADAFHTLSDVLSSVVVLFGFKLSSKGPDEEHPYGHGRIEIIATLIISILLIITGLEFIKASVERLMKPITVGGGWWVVIVMTASAVLKEWMARFASELGHEISSSTLEADAWHHRSDAIASFLVAVGNLAAVKGIYWVDPLLGVGVSILIIYTGWELAKSSSHTLIGASPSSEVIENICSRAKSISGVEDVHKIQVHDYGNHKEVSLHVEVDESMDLLSAHDLADEVEKELTQLLKAQIVVHVEPRSR